MSQAVSDVQSRARVQSDSPRFTLNIKLELMHTTVVSASDCPSCSTYSPLASYHRTDELPPQTPQPPHAYTSSPVSRVQLALFLSPACFRSPAGPNTPSSTYRVLPTSQAPTRSQHAHRAHSVRSRVVGVSGGGGGGGCMMTMMVALARENGVGRGGMECGWRAIELACDWDVNGAFEGRGTGDDRGAEWLVWGSAARVECCCCCVLRSQLGCGAESRFVASLEAGYVVQPDSERSI